MSKAIPSKQAPQDTSIDGYVDAKEASDYLGITRRQLDRRLEKSPIDGVRTDGNGPTARKLYPLDAIKALDEDEEAENDVQKAMSALLREVANLQKSTHQSAQIVLSAATDAVSKVAPFLVAELSRQGDSLKQAQSDTIEALKLTRDMILQRAEMEADRIKREADQAASLEQRKMMMSGFKSLAPALGAAAAKALGLPAEAASQAAIVEVIANLTEEKQGRLVGAIAQSGALTQEEFSSLMHLVDSLKKKDANGSTL